MKVDVSNLSQLNLIKYLYIFNPAPTCIFKEINQQKKNERSKKILVGHIITKTKGNCL